MINIIRDGQGQMPLIHAGEHDTRLAEQSRDAVLDCINLLTQYQTCSSGTLLSASSSMDLVRQSSAFTHRLNSLVSIVTPLARPKDY